MGCRPRVKLPEGVWLTLSALAELNADGAREGPSCGEPSSATCSALASRNLSMELFISLFMSLVDWDKSNTPLLFSLRGEERDTRLDLDFTSRFSSDFEECMAFSSPVFFA